MKLQVCYYHTSMPSVKPFGFTRYTTVSDGFAPTPPEFATLLANQLLIECGRGHGRERSRPVLGRATRDMKCAACRLDPEMTAICPCGRTSPVWTIEAVKRNGSRGANYQTAAYLFRGVQDQMPVRFQCRSEGWREPIPALQLWRRLEAAHAFWSEKPGPSSVDGEWVDPADFYRTIRL